MAVDTLRQECDERTGEYRENGAGKDRDPLHDGLQGKYCSIQRSTLLEESEDGSTLSSSTWINTKISTRACRSTLAKGLQEWRTIPIQAGSIEVIKFPEVLTPD
jgi:hypothetical protein